ncbi:MAG TPA: RNA polymerase sigma factor [Microlunatus sp.]|nr:RNA polymerase sigma factor [Microlunatus sp.]
MASLPPDAELLAGLLAGDEDLFARVVRAWSPAMLRLARYHVGSTAVAEEVVQEAWLAVIKHLAGFERRSALRSWVYRICTNLAHRHGAREARAVPIGMPGEPPTVSPDRFRPPGEEWAGYWQPSRAPADWGPESDALSEESRRVLTEALHTLPDRQAHIVALRDVHGLETAEIADLLGLTPGNVRVILHRSRAALREQLADYFVEEVGTR